MKSRVDKKTNSRLKSLLTRWWIKWPLVIVGSILIALIASVIYDVFIRHHIPPPPSKEGGSINFRNEKEWEQYLGSFLPVDDNQNYFSIASVSSEGLLKFHKQPLFKNQGIAFKFKPWSENAANVVINVGNLYEVIIGDDSYDAVSVKANLDGKGGWEFIPEEQSGALVKKTSYDMRKGAEVFAIINTEYRLDRNYFLSLEIKYIPREPINAGEQRFYGSYVFTPPFLDYEPMYINLGLINTKYQPGIAAEFISFEILEGED